jgi:hypothetical protein
MFSVSQVRILKPNVDPGAYRSSQSIACRNKRPCHYRLKLSVNRYKCICPPVDVSPLIDGRWCRGPKARTNKTACLECHSQEEAMRWTAAKLFLLSDVSVTLVFDLYRMLTLWQEAAHLYLHMDVVNYASHASQQRRVL